MIVRLVLKHDHQTGLCSYHLGRANAAATTGPIELKKNDAIRIVLDDLTWPDAVIESVRIYRPRPGESHQANYESGLVEEITRDEDLRKGVKFNQVEAIKDRGRHIYDLELFAPGRDTRAADPRARQYPPEHLRRPDIALIWNRDTVRSGEQHTYHFGTQVSMGGALYDSDPEMLNKPDRRRREKKLREGLTVRLR